MWRRSPGSGRRVNRTGSIRRANEHPEAIRRNYKKTIIDVAVPLGPGLRSFARISGGYLRYSKITPHSPALIKMQIPVIGGAIQRSDNGSLIAYIESRAPIKNIDDFLVKNGLTTIELRSMDKNLSVKSCLPTRFHCVQDAIFPRGSLLTDPDTWQEAVLPDDILVHIDFDESGVLDNDVVTGTIKFSATMNGTFLLAAEGEFRLNLS